MIKHILLCCVLLFFFSHRSFAHHQKIKIMSYNIRNYGASPGSTNDKLIVNYIKSAAPDIIALQEITNKSQFISSVLKEFPNYSFEFSQNGGSGNQFLGIVYDKNLYEKVTVIELGITKEKKLNNLRPIFIVELKEKKPPFDKITLVSLHLKAGEGTEPFQIRDEQHEIITTIIDELRSQFQMDNFVISGDFNSTNYKFKDNRFDKFNKFVDNTKLEDFGSDEIKCTAYYHKSKGLAPSFLDHILVDQNLANHFSNNYKYEIGGICKEFNCEFINSSIPKSNLAGYYQGSDHCPMILTLKK